MPLDLPDDLIHAAFFFVDIVGLSNPVLSSKTQSTKIKILTESIAECKSFWSTPLDEKLVLPTGDGMAIGFTNGLEKPLLLAKELQKKLEDYNEDKFNEDILKIRIGCHAGNVFYVKDINGKINFWGPGIILTRRVMDLGDADHILMTSSMAETLIELSDDYKKIIHPIHDYQIKHGDVILLYSAYDETFGNSNRPSRGIKTTKKFSDEVFQLKKTIHYKNVDFSLRLRDPKKKLFEITRSYEFLNRSDEPIFEVVNGILTNVEKKFSELNIRVYDENQNELKISGISVDSPIRKEFRITLSKPVIKDEPNRKFSVIYEIEEPKNYYENLFLISSERLTVKFIFPSDEKLNPQLFILEEKNREKIFLSKKREKKHGTISQIEWIKETGIQENDIVRLEW